LSLDGLCGYDRHLTCPRRGPKVATVRPLAYCPTCRIAFPIATRREGGTFVVQNSTTNCPNGHFARILNAHYQAFESEIQATLATHGRGAYRAILALWEKLRRAEVTPEQAQAEAERIRSGLGSIFGTINYSDPPERQFWKRSSPPLRNPPTVRNHPSPNRVRPKMLLLPLKSSRLKRCRKRKGGNRAFQRSLRHRQRLLMNPRIR
jgi:hypothetical protein